MKPLKTIRKRFLFFFLTCLKAFDKIDHGLLVFKLSKTGVGGQLLKLIENCPTNRQFVKVQDCCSESSAIILGAILRPLLFLIFINDLPNVVFHPTVDMFADDSKLSYNEHLGDCYRAQLDLDSIYQWSYESNMNFKLKKCHLISFNKAPKMQIHLGKSIPQDEKSVKDLDLTVQSNLSWSQHVEA